MILANKNEEAFLEKDFELESSPKPLEDSKYQLMIVNLFSTNDVIETNEDPDFTRDPMENVHIEVTVVNSLDSSSNEVLDLNDLGET